MNIRDIERWMMLLLMAVLLTACSDDEEVGNDCFLDIYVYAPGRPVVTRAEVGEITPMTAEATVHTLKIWVFRHRDGQCVGYVSPNPTFLNQMGQQKYQMLLDRTFADTPENVDVYVVANDGSCGLTLGETTTRQELDDAKIGSDYFGTSAPVSSVPDGGLPMSSVLKNQLVSGRFPTLHVGPEDQMATLELTRAVSRLRFVMCRIQEDESTTKTLVSIDNILLSASQIPTATWLMPQASYSYTAYTASPINYGGVSKDDIPEVDNPLDYLYETQSAQEYETLIDNAINATQPQLKQVGLTYLRESDKQLTGTIQYTYHEDTNKQDTVTFKMAAPGDFLRNHSWTVYLFYMDSKIHVMTVTNIGLRSWTSDGVTDDEVRVYNW